MTALDDRLTFTPAAKEAFSALSKEVQDGLLEAAEKSPEVSVALYGGYWHSLWRELRQLTLCTYDGRYVEFAQLIREMMPKPLDAWVPR